MADKIEDGGPAFPHQFEDVSGCKNWMQSQGLSIRDWFAGQALAGFLAADANTEWNSAGAAECSYKMADAMLAARKAGA